MKYVVTAPGRSGTKYTATLLTNAGLNCGHEKVFTGWGPNGRRCPDYSTTEYDGDSCFIAAPFLEEIGDDLVKVHLIRPPLDQIRSVVGLAHVADLTRPWVSFLNIHTGIGQLPPGPQRAAAYWLRWNAMIEPHADLTWKLHDIDVNDLGQLATMAELDFLVGDLEEAVATTDRTINHRERAEWVEMEHLGPMAEPVMHAAERYGVPLASAPPVNDVLHKGGAIEVPNPAMVSEAGPETSGPVVEPKVKKPAPKKRPAKKTTAKKAAKKTTSARKKPATEEA